jgi:ActR/RegA family two-component response regulator
MAMAAGEMILLVNDIPDHVVAYQRALTSYGYRVRLAHREDGARDGEDTLPECAVIDLRLPTCRAGTSAVR